MGGKVKQPRERMLKVNEVADQLNCSRRTVLRWIEDGRLPGAFRLSLSGSSPWRIPESDVQNMLDIARGFKRDDIGSAR